MGKEAVKEPFGPRLGAPVPLAVQVAERTVYDLGNWSLPLTPPCIKVLDGRKLGPSDVLGRTHYLL